MHNQTPFQLVYGREAVVLAEFIISSLLITSTLHLTEEDSIKEHLHELQVLEEDRFMVEFHQTFHKDRQKSWHDHHIKHKMFTFGGKFLLYDRKFQKFPGKLRMRWLGPYHVIDI